MPKQKGCSSTHKNKRPKTHLSMNKAMGSESESSGVGVGTLDTIQMVSVAM